MLGKGGWGERYSVGFKSATSPLNLTHWSYRNDKIPTVKCSTFDLPGYALKHQFLGRSKSWSKHFEKQWMGHFHRIASVNSFPRVFSLLCFWQLEASRKCKHNTDQNTLGWYGKLSMAYLHIQQICFKMLCFWPSSSAFIILFNSLGLH